MRERKDIADTISMHADTVLRVCTVYLHEKADREDVFQETFIRYARHDGEFENDEHVRAWLIRVAANLCKDMLKSAANKTESLEVLADTSGYSPVGDDGQEGQRKLEHDGVLQALNSLDERYRVALYLKYYEGYTVSHIAKITGTPENTVYTNLARGRKLLKGVLQHDRS